MPVAVRVYRYAGMVLVWWHYGRSGHPKSNTFLYPTVRIERYTTLQPADEKLRSGGRVKAETRYPWGRGPVLGA